MIKQALYAVAAVVVVAVISYRLANVVFSHMWGY